MFKKESQTSLTQRINFVYEDIGQKLYTEMTKICLNLITVRTSSQRIALYVQIKIPIVNET